MNVDELLRVQELELSRDAEVNRILDCHPRDPFAILQLHPDNVEKLRATYRKKSLLIHPDKTRHPRAPEAFDLLKKAQLALEDEKQRRALAALYSGIKAQIGDCAHETLQEKVAAALDEQERQQEVERQQQRREEQQRQEEKHEALKARAQRRQWENEWDRTRDGRVKLWRDYKVSKTKRKKKKGVLV